MAHCRPARWFLHLEALESRLVLSAFADALGTDTWFSPPPEGELHPLLVAGDPNGTPSDSPAQRIDPNIATSPFAGVGSLGVATRRGTFLCTATAIGPRHVLTAAHCLDINNDGRADRRDGIRAITFYLNVGGNLTHRLDVTAWSLHPDFTGFARPSVNDDVAVLTLGSALPSGVPVYALQTGSLSQTLTLVGYGNSGDGANGYYLGASFSVKRRGENSPDAFWGQDDAGRPSANEVFRYDFDGPTGSGTFGGPTLGNDRETQLGSGDSGGPSFVQAGSAYLVAGINTFTQGQAPYFGSLGGGMNVAAYAGWIQSVLAGGGAPGGGSELPTPAAVAPGAALALARTGLVEADGAALAAVLSAAARSLDLGPGVRVATVERPGRADPPAPAVPAVRGIEVSAPLEGWSVRETAGPTRKGVGELLFQSVGLSLVCPWEGIGE